MDKVIDRLISKGVGEGYCIYVAHVDDEAGAKVYVADWKMENAEAMKKKDE